MKPLIKTLKGKNKKGKRVLLIAGVHGDELTPVYTIGMMIKRGILDESLKFVKSITVINGLNISGLKEGTREIHSSTTSDLNRMLSNDTKVDCLGILKEHIEKNDVVIDVHSSPTCAEFVLVDIDEYARSVMKWCEESGVKCAFRYSGADTIKRYCLENNKLAVTLELNKMNTFDMGSAARGMDIIRKLIKSSSEFKVEESEPYIDEPVREVKTFKEGIVDYYIQNGAFFSPGDTICSLYDFEMNKIAEITTDTAGWVVCEPSSSYIKRGDTLFLIQPI